MLFLMNDAVLDLDLQALSSPMRVQGFATLTLPAVLRLGAEMFAEAPLLHRTQPERARRLASLITARASQVNAALFEAPRLGCPPERVTSRLAEVSIEVLAELYLEDRENTLTPVLADRRVWRRMAA